MQHLNYYNLLLLINIKKNNIKFFLKKIKPLRQILFMYYVFLFNVTLRFNLNIKIHNGINYFIFTLLFYIHNTYFYFFI